MSTKVLSARLRTMERRGLLLRRELGSSLREVEYSVSPLGRELQPVLASMQRVAGRIRRG